MYAYLPYLKFSDPLPEIHLLFYVALSVDDKSPRYSSKERVKETSHYLEHRQYKKLLLMMIITGRYYHD